jgi:hypothetical protein
MGLILLDSDIASIIASESDSTLGSEKLIIEGGSTSGTPPTLVETTNKPQEAASNKAIQNDSVNEQFKKICPLTKTSLTA